MGNILWLIGIGFIVYGIAELVLGNPDNRKKQKWLLYNFGEQGRQNWLINEFLVFTIKNLSHYYIEWNLVGKPKCGRQYQDYVKNEEIYNKCLAVYGKDCFKDVHVNSDGSIQGLLRNVTGKGAIGAPQNDFSPWNQQSDPNGSDWLAAGYQTQFVLNGKIINPVAMYKQEGGKFAKC